MGDAGLGGGEGALTAQTFALAPLAAGGGVRARRHPGLRRAVRSAGRAGLSSWASALTAPDSDSQPVFSSLLSPSPPRLGFSIGDSDRLGWGGARGGPSAGHRRGRSRARPAPPLAAGTGTCVGRRTQSRAARGSAHLGPLARDARTQECSHMQVIRRESTPERTRVWVEKPARRRNTGFAGRGRWRIEISELYMNK